MLDTAKYVNHLNQSIDFGSGGIFITDSELRDYEWEYDTDYDEITNFRKGIKKKKMKIIISAVTEEEGIAKRNAVFRISKQISLQTRQESCIRTAITLIAIS